MHPRRASRERGYALLMVMFIAALMFTAVMTIAPNILTQAKREKEEEMIWRGKQYVRGIKLYYRKLGRFPTSLDDLTKPKVGTLRFMRQAYKDPMNKADGSWRMIYVGPAGQLIGSLKPPQTINLSATGGAQPGTPAATMAGANQTQPGASAGQPPAGAQAGATPGAPGSETQQNPASGDQGESPTNPAPGSLTETPTIIGGNIIGVGSKVAERSIRIYEKAKNYRLYEFVWDPSKDVLAIGGQVGTQVGTPVNPGQGQGQAPFGVPPMQNPMNPPPNAQQPPPNPNPNPNAPPQ
ncbi:MAG: hypothetical protein ACHQLQ_02175 [Candidatus Acidiferrales bacterium]